MLDVIPKTEYVGYYSWYPWTDTLALGIAFAGIKIGITMLLPSDKEYRWLVLLRKYKTFLDTPQE